MSAARWLVPVSLMVCASAWAQTATRRPVQPGQVRVSETPARPTTQPVSYGSINDSMRHLATIPRARTAREASANSPENRYDPRLPHSRVLPGADRTPAASDNRPLPPADRADASGGSRSIGGYVVRDERRGPTADEMRRAFPNSERYAEITTQPAIAPYSFAPVTWGVSPYSWGPRNSGLPQWRRNFANRRFFDGMPGLYGYGRNAFPYGGGDDWAGDAYRFGFTQGMDYGLFYDESNARTDSVLKHYAGHLSRALQLFNTGRYVEAADAFQLAADMHQGDPACRLYAAHSLFAIGRYRDAIPFLRRALQLQPRIVYLGFDIRDDYGQKQDFNHHLAALQAALNQSPNNLDRLILLGYVYYFCHERDRAYSVLREAYRLDPRDPLIVALLDNSRPPDVMLDQRSR